MATNPKKLSEDFGDLEFRWDLDKQQAWNPLARLGFAPKQSKTIGLLTNGKNQALYVPSASDAHNTQAALIKKHKLQQEDAINTYPDDVRATVDYAKPEIWNHEYTHRGFDKILQDASKDPNSFVDKYGKDTFEIAKALSVSKDKREYFTELMDDTSVMKGKHLQKANLGEVQAFQKLVLGRDVDTSAITRESLVNIFPYAKLLKAAKGLLGEEAKEKKGKPKDKDKSLLSLFSSLF